MVHSLALDTSSSKVHSYKPRNTTMLRENGIYAVTRTPKSESSSGGKDSSNSLSDDIDQNISRRKSQMLFRKLTPNSKSFNSNKLQLKPSLTLNDLSQNNKLLCRISESPVLLGKKRRPRHNKRASDENDMEDYYTYESNQMGDSQLDFVRKSMQESKKHSQGGSPPEEDCAGTESKRAEYCSREQLQRLLRESEFRINTYISGSYLGDEEILQKSNRLYNCRARTDVELMMLTKADFEFYLLQEFPHVYEKIVKYAKQKREYNQSCVKKMLKSVQISAKQHGVKIKHVG